MAIVKNRPTEVDHMIDDYIDRLPGEDTILSSGPDRIAMLSDAAAARVKNDYRRKYDRQLERIERLKQKKRKMMEMLDSAIEEAESQAQECLTMIEAIELRDRLPFDEDTIITIEPDDYEPPTHYGIMVVKQPNRTEAEELASVLGSPLY